MKYIIIIIVLLTFGTSCKKLIQIDGPATAVSSKNVYNNDATAIGALTSLYVSMANKGEISSPGGLTSLSCIAGLSADELNCINGASMNLRVYYQNVLNNLNAGNGYWGGSYLQIFVINSVIEGLSASSSLTPAVKQQLLGEARFMRAFYYFYLVNLYGEVPLVLTSDYTINSLIRQSPVTDVYHQIVADLVESKKLLSEEYLLGDCITPYPNSSEERVRPTKWVASALLARTYLYMKEWSNAETEATSVINNKVQFELVPINQVFLKNNRESIWQLQPVISGVNTPDANTFILTANGPSFNNPVFLNEDLIKDFETLDQRRINWIGSNTTNQITYFYPYKYKILRSSNHNADVIEYSVVMRLAEQYLIRAEARAQLDDLKGTVEDIDQIRQRAGISLLKGISPDISKDLLLVEILKQRRLELFTEWGNRWFDLKRTGRIDEIMNIMTPKKGNSQGWKSYQKYYPVDLGELKLNPNLKPTPGY